MKARTELEDLRPQRVWTMHKGGHPSFNGRARLRKDKMNTSVIARAIRVLSITLMLPAALLSAEQRGQPHKLTDQQIRDAIELGLKRPQDLDFARFGSRGAGEFTVTVLGPGQRIANAAWRASEKGRTFSVEDVPESMTVASGSLRWNQRPLNRPCRH